MTIDIAKDKLVRIADLPSRLPKKAGKKINISTVYRWTNPGLCGVTLEVINIGGTKYTTMAALNAFFRKVTEVKTGVEISTANANASHTAAQSELKEAGW